MKAAGKIRETDWREVRFRYVADVQKGRLPSSSGGDSGCDRAPYLSMEYLRGAETDQPTLFPVEPDAIMASDGDTLLLWDGSNAGEFLRARRGIVSSTTALIRPRSVDPAFFYWACKAREARLRVETVGMGIPHVDPEVLANLRLPLPTLRQQRRISTYLDRATANLDALIGEKERIANLLEERRRSITTRAVTRGLDPDAPLRDSGIPWLGEVPEHWDTERARWLFTERDERSATGEEELLTVSHLTGVTPRAQKTVNMFEAATKKGYKVCVAGDLVINTMWAWMGAMGVARMNGIVSPAYNVYEPATRLDPGYAAALVRLPVFAQEATRYSKGVWSSRLRLYPQEFFAISLPVPPLSEQREIAAHLDLRTVELGELRAATQSAITLLRERRVALIAAAVSGHLHVEGEA